MATTNLFRDNIVIQHLKAKPTNQWNEEDILHMYTELEDLKTEISICSVVPSTIGHRVQLQLMYSWLNNHRLTYEEHMNKMLQRQALFA